VKLNIITNVPILNSSPGNRRKIKKNNKSKKKVNVSLYQAVKAHRVVRR
jgi:hypothetical protein